MFTAEHIGLTQEKALMGDWPAELDDLDPDFRWFDVDFDADGEIDSDYLDFMVHQMGSVSFDCPT